MIPAHAEPTTPALDSAAPAPVPVDASAPARRILAVLGLMALVVILAIVSWHAVWRNQPDFEYFYKGGRALLEHGSLDNGYDRLANGAMIPRGRLDWYLPFVPRVMTLLAWMPAWIAGVVWLAANLAALAALLVLLVRRFTRFAPPYQPLALFAVVLCLPLAWYWEFRLNQIDTLTLLLLVSSYLLWERGRHGVAGFWLGLAVLLKLTPVLLILWFALKRQFRTVAVALLTVALAGPAADVIALHPHYMAECYDGWATAAMHDASHMALVRAEREMDWRNQGLGAVLARWLTHTNWRTQYDNEPRATDDPDAAYFNPVDLPRAVIGGLATAMLVGLILVLAWLARVPAGKLSHRALRSEWALCLLLILLAMPVLRRYHMVMALPAVLLLSDALYQGLLAGRAAALALGCILFLAGAQWALLLRGGVTPNLFEAGGGLLLTIVLLLLPLLIVRARSMRPEIEAALATAPENHTDSADHGPSPAAYHA